MQAPNGSSLVLVNVFWSILFIAAVVFLWARGRRDQRLSARQLELCGEELGTARKEVERLQNAIDASQRVTGSVVAEALAMAAKSNVEHNRYEDGRVSRLIGPMYVGVLPDNGSSYSVFVRCEDRGALYPLEVLQVSVNLGASEERRVHVHYGSYGRDVWYPIEQLLEVIGGLVDEVIDWSAFTREKAKEAVEEV